MNRKVELQKDGIAESLAKISAALDQAARLTAQAHRSLDIIAETEAAVNRALVHSMPKRVDVEIGEINVREMDDAAFVRELAAITAKDDDLVKKMLSYGRLIRLADTALEAVSQKMTKLRERVKTDGGIEGNAAKILLTKHQAAEKALKIRRELAVKYFLAERQAVLKCVCTLTKRVSETMTDPSDETDSNARRYDVIPFIETISNLEQKLRMGKKRSVYSTKGDAL